jgi:hypothetical protein
MWQGMGSKRPEVLIKIERVLWQAILNMTRSPREDMGTLLKLTFQQIDALLGLDVDILDIDWFDKGKHYNT